MNFTQRITISENDYHKITHYLSYEPCDEDDYNDNCLSEDEVIRYSAAFSNGYCMDIKVCGVHYDSYSSTAWSEAVLFDEKGCEVCCSEPSDVFVGEWVLTYKNSCGVEDSYIVNIVPDFDFIIKDGVLVEYIGDSEEVFVPSSVHSIGTQAFMNNNKIKSVFLPPCVKEVGVAAFYGCTSLVSFVASGITLIDKAAFQGCLRLSTAHLPETLTELGVSSFGKCYSLSSFYVPDGVRRINHLAFADCTSLETISIPDTIEYVGNDVFINCDSLQEPIIRCSPEQQMINDGVLPEDIKLALQTIKEMKIQNKDTISAIEEVERLKNDTTKRVYNSFNEVLAELED